MRIRRNLRARLSRVGTILILTVATAALGFLPAAADDINVLGPNLLAYNGFDNIVSSGTAQAGGIAVDQTCTNGSGQQYDCTPRSFGGGDSFDDVGKGDNAHMYYTSATNHSSGTDIAINSSSQTSGAAYVGWGPSTLNPTNSTSPMEASMNVWFTQVPDSQSGALQIMNFIDTGGTLLGSVRIDGNDSLSVCNTSGNCTVGGTPHVQTGQWYRIAASVNPRGGDNAVMSAYLFTNTSSTNPNDTESIALSGGTYAHPVGHVRFGNLYFKGDPDSHGNGQGLGTMWIDKLQVSNTGVPGPYNTPGSGGQFNITENFEKGTLGDFNIHSSDYGNDVNGIWHEPACATQNPMSSGDTHHFCSTNTAINGVQSFAKMTPAVFGANKRNITLTFKYKYTGSCNFTVGCSPASGGGNPLNQPVVTVFNSDPVRYSGGGNFNMWIQSGTGHLRGDLVSTCAFDSGTVFDTSTVHTIKVIVYYRANGHSTAEVFDNGTEVGAINATTPNTNGFNNGDELDSVSLGSTNVNPDYQALYDDISAQTLTTSPGNSAIPNFNSVGTGCQ